MATDETGKVSMQNKRGTKSLQIGIKPQHRTKPPEPVLLIPAAQYVRMSDEAQQYSIENQKAAIQEYAARHSFLIVRTYADAGKSGVIAKNRPALRELLKDVVSGDTGYKAILVYDVSRWGRFPNNDEAAHYEFMCSSSGIPLHYCAEPFTNDGTATSSLLKALKRSMAAEFSRELGEKVFRGKTRLVQLGFWVGGPAGYGYRRLMVSEEGKQKQFLEPGERKSLTTDRVILVPGPRLEVTRVREMFSMVLDGVGYAAIAQDLNRRGNFKPSGKPWYDADIRKIITHPKYAGCNVWYRRTGRLRGKESAVEPRHWISKPAAFAPIIDSETFDRAQAVRPRRSDLWSDDKILKKMRRLLRSKGYLSVGLIDRTSGMPSSDTLGRHFGTYRQLYKAVGYQLPPYDWYHGAAAEPSMRLRRNLVKQLSEMFPEHVMVTSVPQSSRSILEIDHSFMVSVLLCRTYQIVGKPTHWVVRRLTSAERGHITLLCKVSQDKRRIESYHLVPKVDIPGRTRKTRLCNDDPLLSGGIRLQNLSGFYAAVNALRHRELGLTVTKQGSDPSITYPPSI
jgi:DNA invertase Pin-like site-specific DNA recombinase